MIIRKELVCGKKYSRGQGSRETHRNISHANKSWITVVVKLFYKPLNELLLVVFDLCRFFFVDLWLDIISGFVLMHFLFQLYVFILIVYQKLCLPDNQETNLC